MTKNIFVNIFNILIWYEFPQMPEHINRPLLKRLLHLFPFRIVKDYFDKNGKFEDIIEEVSAGKFQDILNFSLSYHSFTRQSIYLFNLDKIFVMPKNIKDFPLIIENGDGEGTLNNGMRSFFCLPETTFRVYLSDPIDEDTITFYQPVLIKVKGTDLVIQFTKLKKNVDTYFPAARNPKKAGEENSEEDTLRNIISYFSVNYSVLPNDLNKGMKYLWHIDDVDCHKVSYKDSHSTTIVTMNQDLTFKQQYPVKYSDMINEPIGDATWKYLVKNKELCDLFNCNPTDGKISIGKSPANVNQIDNVITRILRHN